MTNWLRIPFYKIRRGWHVMRWLRFGMGLALLLQSILLKDAMMIVASVLFTLMAVFNYSCCGSASCALDESSKSC
ncbi:MAG: hypothetical protein HWD58_00890 [Bacteroidota bacterium]|nr:MAG: hypothetical protein HWD58_00890 [Bacteroidota bacterium]